jgi:hypothetical protein
MSSLAVAKRFKNECSHYSGNTIIRRKKIIQIPSSTIVYFSRPISVQRNWLIPEPFEATKQVNDSPYRNIYYLI